MWSIAIIDIDHFKCINDQYGHQVGDIVLRETAQNIKKMARHDDIVARYGGEEFVVVLFNCDLKKAEEWGERIRKYIAYRAIPVGDDKINVTVSVGVSSSLNPVHNLNDVLRFADLALYNAKENGRNKVSICNSSE